MIRPINFRMNEQTAVINYYQKVIDSTSDIDIIKRAARIMVFSKDYPAANRAVNRWLELSPKDVEARQVATTTSLYQGDVDSAVMHLEWLLAQAKDKQQGFNLIAALLDRVPDKPIAVAAMEEMSSRYPQVIEGHIYLARLAHAAEQYELAVVKGPASCALRSLSALPSAICRTASAVCPSGIPASSAESGSRRASRHARGQKAFFHHAQ